MIDKIVSKLTSGKFILTMVASGVFAYLSCKGMLPAEDVKTIVLVVVYAYFTKQNGANNESKTG